jgi:lysophospholipase L1-like esterase
MAMAGESEPYRRDVAAAPSQRILIVGDSTAVGTGARSPAASVAGRIGALHADASIVNLAEDGARVADVVLQLERAEPARFDMVLIQAGANDVLRLASPAAQAADWTRVITAARGRADRVLVMPAGNVGTAPFFFPPISWFMTSRARQARDIARQAAERHGAAFVNLFHERDAEPFLADPERFYAPDYLHPSDEGYALWFQALQAQARI